jgi:ketosteroid isomerase-like protein
VGVQRGRVHRPPTSDVRPSAPRGWRGRSLTVRTSARGRGIGTIAMWPLEATDGYPRPARETDSWARLVREAIELYRTGRADAARQLWTDDIVWRVIGDGAPSGEHQGAEAIFAYHRRAARLTDGTYRQELVAFEGGGPIVTAYLRTRAQRGERTLDIPSLVVFEVARMQIRRVAELPGDQEAWNRFWAD